MQPPLEAAEPFEIASRDSCLTRALVLICGIACIVIPSWELRHAFTQIGWWTLFVGVIVVGAWSIGLTLLVGAVTGETLRWTFRDGILVLKRSSPLRERTQVIRAPDVERIEIRTIEWDSTADTYSVVLCLKTGERAETPDFRTRAAAQALEATIRGRLGLA
jgi:uncharacterized membrane protein YdbT with pleckstrin-like domain